MDSFHEMAGYVTDKMAGSIKRSGIKIPYTTENGVFDDRFAREPDWWTNGFWQGIIWLMYQKTGDPYYKSLGSQLEERMDAALFGHMDGGIDALHHDVGFMWVPTSLANYLLTGNKESRTRSLIAANYLASRFNHKGGYIIAWNGKEHEGWSIIDTMMNLPLLYWASEETGYSRFRNIAEAHADKAMANHVRPDGSCEHIVIYDAETGVKTGSLGGQGYAVGSSWTRGQAWGLYGYALSFAHTKNQAYLSAAKKIAHYYIAAIAPFDYMPPVDFRAPAEPVTLDTSSGAIAACGLLEISKHAGGYEKDLYISAAEKIVRALYEHQCDLTNSCDALLRNSSESYYPETKRHLSIIYGDYFFMEALYRMDGMEFSMW